jgi:hypothetical protein
LSRIDNRRTGAAAPSNITTSDTQSRSTINSPATQTSSNSEVAAQAHARQKQRGRFGLGDWAKRQPPNISPEGIEPHDESVNPEQIARSVAQYLLERRGN